MRALCFILLLFSCSAHSETLSISQFAQDSIEGWSVKSFTDETNYTIVDSSQGKVLQARANASSSGLVISKRIDLFETPYLNWSWKAQSSLTGLDEQSKQGDDYVARVYIVMDGGWQFWNTRALNYVWSSNQQKFSHWDNAYAGEAAKMLAIRGVESPVNRWHFEKRQVYQDLIEYFGDMGSDKKNQQAYRYIDAVALMTDSDDSKRQAQALYGDIWFSKD
ncbi:DUF3047 domain-containing protein [Vibrio ulleungensis]|uniref:DUF3047 domain-containing protein n=1 Tax=Vibrio ulleungensis TaxID=2807619 RepID=A0ABS2HKN7_9VIBR|nr:DUF3047 domain-containing protein [Vibrio ulleungensis]MBM7036677.1 DUF3047 domain-containing protein [Vibrio ulleungensis]